MKQIITSCLLLLFILPLSAQRPHQPNAAELHQAIKKLNVLGSVLYVAAHPDDENQRIISYFENERLFDVTYLSLTRGDGGQNLIGSELRELLGVLRTQELLMARSIDGGNQRFSRANDFGYSKTPEETQKIWNRDEVMSDIVWTIRNVRPDMVINRFYHGTKYRTHGHHSSSAILSTEAFDLCGDPTKYPEQLSMVDPWQPSRIFFNTSWWFYGSREKFEEADKTNLYSVDIGVYLPLKGQSNTELASEARSMHRCQGFGAMTYRGENTDWLEFIKGDRPAEKTDPVSGINTTWSRVEGGEAIGKRLSGVEKDFQPANPSASVPGLVEAMQMIKKLPDSHWKRVKLREIKEVIKGCMGLYLEATAQTASATPGESVEIHFEAVNRSELQLELGGLMISHKLKDTIFAYPLSNNELFIYDTSVDIPENAPFTAPYWLNEKAELGMYQVDKQELRGLPETPRYLQATWSFVLNGVPLEYTVDVAYKERRPEKGEVWQPFEVLPPVFISFTEPNYLFTEDKGEIRLRVKAGRDNVSGAVHLSSPKGWIAMIPSGENRFDFKRKGEEQEFVLEMEHTGSNNQVELQAYASVDGKNYGSTLVEIDYDHIPTQSVLIPATAPTARVDLKCTAKKVGYYMGAGDAVPEALRLMGCEVIMLEDEDITTEKLAGMDALVVGIRAYNTRENIVFHQSKFLEYVKNGGTMVVQYNTNRSLVTPMLAPYTLKLSRGRVTEEDAEIRLLAPDHPAMQGPNKITSADFDGWVQERGLYFPETWDEKNFTALISSNDTGEEPLDGSLLVAKFGKGHYVYTGLSFFRELPAGVPGAYRLFANLISLGND